MCSQCEYVIYKPCVDFSGQNTYNVLSTNYDPVCMEGLSYAHQNYLFPSKYLKNISINEYGCLISIGLCHYARVQRIPGVLT